MTGDSPGVIVRHPCFKRIVHWRCRRNYLLYRPLVTGEMNWEALSPRRTFRNHRHQSLLSRWKWKHAEFLHAPSRSNIKESASGQTSQEVEEHVAADRHRPWFSHRCQAFRGQLQWVCVFQFEFEKPGRPHVSCFNSLVFCAVNTQLVTSIFLR